MNRVDTVVVGGGIAGLTATAFVVNSGNSAILYEKERYFGGLVNTFTRGKYQFDGGLRSVENSGIVRPMLKQLGIDLELVKSNVSLIVGKNVLRLKDSESILEYRDFLIKEFSSEKTNIDKIITEITKITKYMDVLYGIDNPIFLDPVKDRDYLLRVIVPWLFKFIKTIGKIEKLDEPVNEYLKKFTSNQELIDNITQHFFKETPASFALSYFSLYNDYNYPIGGTGALPKSLEGFSKKNGADLRLQTLIVEVNPEEKYVVDNNGAKQYYRKLIWACDLKMLYKAIDLGKIKNNKVRRKIEHRTTELQNLRGAESVFSIYLSVNLPPPYFKNIASEHAFFTPVKDGLSKVPALGTVRDKESIKKYLTEYVKFNTFEISIPCLRDPNMAPDGQTGVEISILFDYDLARQIVTQGWKKEFKIFMEELLIEQSTTLYPELQKNVIKQFSSTPLTIKRYTSNTDGAIIGWSFTNPKVPVVSKIRKVSKSVQTPMKDIYKCGQWAYSPAGMPISILTGKLAANRAIK